MSLITPARLLDASLDALGPLVARTAVAAAGVTPGRVGLFVFFPAALIVAYVGRDRMALA